MTFPGAAANVRTVMRALPLMVLLSGGVWAASITVVETDRGYRYETPRAIVEFDRGPMRAEARMEFARPADRGVEDLAGLLGVQAGRDGELLFRVRRRAGISRTYGARISLPYGRVADRSAPYLHETVHALLSAEGADPPLWLSEGLASYLESYVAEKVGGYQGHVFSEGGNLTIDAEARRHLTSGFGRDAFDAVGLRRVPRNIDRDRGNVARPFYLLSQSFVKYLAEHAGLDAVLAAYRGSSDRVGGRTVLEWKADWRRFLASGAI
jgi:hypothetical protein